jgi:hypothetical protein
VVGFPSAERGDLRRDALSVGTYLQYRGTPVDHDATDDDGHAPSRDDLAELDSPPLCKVEQNRWQLVQPRFDVVAVARDQARSQSGIEVGQQRSLHGDRTSMGAALGRAP